MHRTFLLFASCWLAIACFLPGTDAGEARTLFFSDFNEGDPGELPLLSSDDGPWARFSAGSSYQEGSLSVLRDEEDWFGEGAENQMLSVRNGGNFNLRAGLSSAEEVVTLSMDFIGRNSPEENRWLNINFLTSRNPPRAYALSLRLTNQTIRDLGISYGKNDSRLRVTAMLNNSASPVDYERPGGGTAILEPGRAAVWINGQVVIPDYIFARDNEAFTAIHSIAISPDSSSVVSFDLNEFAVFEGAHVAAGAG